MKEMSKNPSLGFLKLISMGCIAAVTWLFMMLFILVF
jgi:hypothetical protein